MWVLVIVSSIVSFSPSLRRDDCPKLSNLSNAIPLTRDHCLYSFLVGTATVVRSLGFKSLTLSEASAISSIYGIGLLQK